MARPKARIVELDEALHAKPPAEESAAAHAELASHVKAVWAKIEKAGVARATVVVALQVLLRPIGRSRALRRWVTKPYNEVLRSLREALDNFGDPSRMEPTLWTLAGPSAAQEAADHIDKAIRIVEDRAALWSEISHDELDATAQAVLRDAPRWKDGTPPAMVTTLGALATKLDDDAKITSLELALLLKYDARKYGACTTLVSIARTISDGKSAYRKAKADNSSS